MDRMNRPRLHIRALLIFTLIFSLSIINACNKGSYTKSDELIYIQPADETGQGIDDGLSVLPDDKQNEADLPDDQSNASEQSGMVSENEGQADLKQEQIELLTDKINYAALRELIKKAIDSRSDTTIEFNGTVYSIIEVDGGDLSGERKALVAVDIGFGDRQYWAFTNEYGQLEYVYADRIIPQDEENEKVTAAGRYYADEAKVPSTERKDLDEGHVIADSLGGVSNAYNITPQNSKLNRHGNQAYMEKVIRDAGGCENFFAHITYPDTTSQIPTHYHYEYVLKGINVVDDFDNVDPDEVNGKLIQEEQNREKIGEQDDAGDSTKDSKEHDLSKVDKNGDGKVTIAEAKAAGYKMPILSDHWLYPYMDDRDGDGMVGE